MAKNTGKGSRQGASQPPRGAMQAWQNSQHRMSTLTNNMPIYTTAFGYPLLQQTKTIKLHGIDFAMTVDESRQVVAAQHMGPAFSPPQGVVVAPQAFWDAVDRDEQDAVTVVIDVSGEAIANPMKVCHRQLPHSMRSGAKVVPERAVEDLKNEISALAASALDGTTDPVEAASIYAVLRVRLDAMQRTLLEADGMLDAAKARISAAGRASGEVDVMVGADSCA